MNKKQLKRKVKKTLKNDFGITWVKEWMNDEFEDIFISYEEDDFYGISHSIWETSEDLDCELRELKAIFNNQ